MGNKTTFLYLDGHWYADLPLQEEIDLIAANWNGFCILIDDFRAPGDEGYGYDFYSFGSLELDLIQNSIANMTSPK
jgi:prepilin-type processing-associated H-X9-DG protein